MQVHCFTCIDFLGHWLGEVRGERTGVTLLIVAREGAVRREWLVGVEGWIMESQREWAA